MLKLQSKFKSSIYLKTSRIFSAKKTGFSIILFLILYIVLLNSFYIYIGITSEGGKLFSPFLNKYADFPGWLSIVLADMAKLFLQLMGYTIFQLSPANVTIAGSRGVTLAWACLGAGAMSLWIAFIAAHNANIRFKLKWMATGLALICFINVLRIMMIALSNHYHWAYVRHFDAHTSFNIVTYAFILLFMFLFIRKYASLKNNL